MIDCTANLAAAIAHAEAPIIRRFTPYRLYRVECAQAGGIVRYDLRMIGGKTVRLHLRYVRPSESHGTQFYEDMSGDLKFNGRIIRVEKHD